MNLSSKKLIFVTGKGGVGKSLTAAAVAWNEARRGRKVCLVELGGQSFYESLFETRGIGYEASEVVPDIHIALFNPENCIKEYILHFLKVPKLYDLFFQNKVMKAFMNAAPALAELSILGKLTSETRGIFKAEYDVHVVDCYSTGHAMALLRAPAGLHSAFRSGNLADQARDIDAILRDPVLTHYVLVTLPEEMPVSEGGELYDQLRGEFNAAVSVVCNKLIEPPVPPIRARALREQVGDPALREFLDYLVAKSTVQTTQLARLEKKVGEFYGAPLILDAQRGIDYVERLAKCLENPWISPSS